MIRVIRVLQYTYPDAEHMARDMERWTPTVSSAWTKGSVSMQSTHFIPEWTADEEDEQTQPERTS